MTAPSAGRGSSDARSSPTDSRKAGAAASNVAAAANTKVKARYPTAPPDQCSRRMSAAYVTAPLPGEVTSRSQVTVGGFGLSGIPPAAWHASGAGAIEIPTGARAERPREQSVVSSLEPGPAPSALLLCGDAPSCLAPSVAVPHLRRALPTVAPRGYPQASPRLPQDREVRNSICIVPLRKAATWSSGSLDPWKLLSTVRR